MRFYSVPLLFTIFCALIFPTANAVNSTATGCPCGYFDSTAQNLFTESIIVYFNETTALPIPGFLEESFSHDYEKGWNTQFREGASVSNVDISDSPYATNTSAFNSSTSLELHVSPYRPDHLVVGGSIRTARQDIQYGSFTSLLRSPGQWAGGGGSALSMTLKYNLTQQLTMDLQNTDKPSSAKVNMLANEEFPDETLAVPYGNMTNGTFPSPNPGNHTLSPWNYTEFRIDWTDKEVKFYIGGLLARTILKSENTGLLSTPSPFYLRHWSNGNTYASQGPPVNKTVANVGWTRMFFNSSSMTELGHSEFDAHCQVSDACLTSDMTLRGTTSYPQEAILQWKQKIQHRPRRPIAIWFAVACISMTTLLLVKPMLKRVGERLPNRRKAQKSPEPSIEAPLMPPAVFDSKAGTLANNTPSNRTRAPSLSATTLNETRPNSASTTPFNRTRPSSIISKKDGKEGIGRTSAFHESMPQNANQIVKDSYSKYDSKDFAAFMSTGNPSQETMPKGAPPSNEITITRAWIPSEDPFEDGMTITRAGMSSENPSQVAWPSRELEEDAISFREALGKSWVEVNEKKSETSSLPQEKGKGPVETLGPAPSKEGAATAQAGKTEGLTNLPEAKKRVDYLAGLVAVSSLLVTAIHFNLTFVFGVINAGAYTHYHSETVARKTIGSFVLNLIWIGPFLMTSTRFLVTSYLKNGELLPIAEKTVGRTPRLLIPVTAIAMLEYFFINAGATKWLEYLPSVSWSSWPFTVGYTSFGNFLSEVLELMYLIPNAAPQITFNYCTGVLWTIPVQLQGSWVTILGVIVIREIKTPWKRFCFYAFCIVNHWYALSWGTYFYLGIMLTDLDVTYKYRTYLYARPFVYYPFLTFCALVGFAGLATDLTTQWTKVNYATYEYAIHPDINSGLPISQAGHATYPQYFVPRLNGIAFAVGFQAVVELSPLVQKLFSFKLLVFVFPHIFTIYLFHGFIFWSLGSFLCIQLSVHGFAYWLNILIVALACYSTLAISLPLLTPIVETLGKNLTMDIWQYAREAPPPRRPTLHPFPADLFLSRYETPHDEAPTKDMKIDKLKDKVESVEVQSNQV
ncbi:hypothetical protein MMC28_010362 [Mycoblastus sanguinarius]|nr:hypothetical protein [Mycoblastus sanguinarius]